MALGSRSPNVSRGLWERTRQAVNALAFERCDVGHPVLCEKQFQQSRQADPLLTPVSKKAATLRRSLAPRPSGRLRLPDELTRQSFCFGVSRNLTVLYLWSIESPLCYEETGGQSLLFFLGLGQ